MCLNSVFAGNFILKNISFHDKMTTANEKKLRMVIRLRHYIVVRTVSGLEPGRPSRQLGLAWPSALRLSRKFVISET